ncbi:MAG: hypothetical protein LBC83_08635 [Oscillospiraceae bacterium]|jgi:formate C-acetyltransferase|nr:hypothetical protein [Oscillospiraceae bacterium]
MHFSTAGSEELAAYYSQQEKTPAVQALLAELATLCAATQGQPACLRKAQLHERIARVCDVKVFAHFPFFWAISDGRSRTNWGVRSPVSQLWQATEESLTQPYQEEIAPYIDAALFHGWRPIGYDHHCPSYDRLLSEGLSGIIARARAQLEITKSQDGRVFLEACIRSNEAVILLAERFAQQAEALFANAPDEAAARNLRRIAATARRIPAQPAATFYEAICCILFMREIIGSLEGFGVSTFGHLDRLLYPYYADDLAAGRINRAEAKDLLAALFIFTDAKFGLTDSFAAETSTTIVLGGCDAAGAPVCNDITHMLLEAAAEGGYTGTKLIARISSVHPAEYFNLLGQFISEGHNVLVMPNDDTLIPASCRWNKRLEDARLYVGGGCHEVVLGGTEVCTRADSWISLPGLLLQTLFPSSALPAFFSCTQADCYEAFYRACMANVHLLHNRIAAAKERYERIWRDFDATPLYSATLAGCIENARDVTAGGARYNTVSLSMFGAATFLDSLFAIKTLVFEEKQCSFADFRAIVSQNFAEHEELRQYILHRLPRHGQGDAAYNAFAADVLRDLSCVAGQPNGRGGIVTPAFYPHDIFLSCGCKTQATPDGRLAFTPFSRGFSPSENTPIASVTDIIRNLQAFDLTLFPESFATELTLPAAPDKNDATAIAALIQTFAEYGGSTLQLNVLDYAVLRDALEHPEAHPNLTVRVCGYSQSFNSLSAQQKNEVIGRMMEKG